jgi:hypothetical protein
MAPLTKFSTHMEHPRLRSVTIVDQIKAQTPQFRIDIVFRNPLHAERVEDCQVRLHMSVFTDDDRQRYLPIVFDMEESLVSSSAGIYLMFCCTSMYLNDMDESL